MATKQELEKELKEKENQITEQGKELELLKQQMAQLMSMIQNQNNNIVSQSNTLSSRKIKVISLIPNELNLTTEELGAGKKFRFDRFGDEHKIRYDDLEEIVRVNRWIFEKGLAYIGDKEAIFELGLEDYYEKMLDKNGIQNIAKLENPHDVDMICNMNEIMLEKVTDLIIEDLVNGGNREWVKLAEIKNRTGIDILEKVEKLNKINVKGKR